MNVLKYRVSLDMFDTLSQITIKAKKGDSACQIHITLTENGKIYKLSDGCNATFSGKKADGTFVYDNCTIVDNTIVYDFSSSIDDNGVCQLTAYEGNVECEIALFKDSNQLTAPRFTLVVDGTVYNGEEIVSTPSVNAVKKLIDESVLSINGELNIWQHDTLDGLYIIRGGTHLTASLRGDVTSDGLLLTPTIVSIGSVSDSDAYAYVYSYSLYEKRCLIYAHNIICFSIKSGLVPGTDGKPSHYEDTFKDISNEIVGGQGSGNGVVDQSYNPESENAQSGKAVAQAIAGIGGSGGGGDVSNKMDKFGTVKKGGNNGQTIQLDTLTYLNDSNGQTVAMIGMSTDELNLNKNLGMMNKKITNLGNPTTDTDAVNKNYVDTAIGNIDSALDSIIAIQNSILGGGA